MSFMDVLLSIFWFMMLVAWFWLMVSIIGDIFRDQDLSGWGKGLWCLFVVLLPWLGVLVYLIARGGSMHERAAERAQQNEAAFQEYVRRTAASGGAGVADELAKLAKLRDEGTISSEDYERAKSKVLHHDAGPTDNFVPGTPGPRTGQTVS